MPCDVGPFLNAAGLTRADLVNLYLARLADVKEINALNAELSSLTQPGTTTTTISTELLDHLLATPSWRMLTQLVIFDLFYGLFVGNEEPGVLLAPGSSWGPAFTQIGRDRYWEEFVDSYVEGDLRVIPGGAAGNGIARLDGKEITGARRSFPFAPALWNAVTSVSASDGTGNLASYSNSGEVRVDGRSAKVDGTELNGTSFATPRLAALQAVYLLSGGAVRCGDHRPPFGYANLTPSNVPDWRDVTFAQAQATNCQSFAGYVAALQ